MSKIKIVSKEELLLLPHKDIVRFALFCAEQVRDGWENIPECVNAINIVERWLEGKATEEECWKATEEECWKATEEECWKAAYAASHAAAYAANAATYPASASAAYAASAAANAADYASASAGNPHLIEAQWNYYEELLHFDDIAEKLLLGETV